MDLDTPLRTEGFLRALLPGGTGVQEAAGGLGVLVCGGMLSRKHQEKMANCRRQGEHSMQKKQGSSCISICEPEDYRGRNEASGRLVGGRAWAPS